MRWIGSLSSVSCFSGLLLFQEKQEENELRALPPPSEAQLWAVDAAVLEAARVQGISEEDFQQRQAVVSRMEETIQQHLTGEINVPEEGGELIIHIIWINKEFCQPDKREAEHIIWQHNSSRVDR